MTDTNLLRQRLEEAEEAMHRFVLGERVVEVETVEGDRVRYESSRRGDLARYIAGLKVKLGESAGGGIRVWY